MVAEVLRITIFVLYLGIEHVLIDIGNMTVRSSYLSRHSAGPFQLNLSRPSRYYYTFIDRRCLPGRRRNAANLQQTTAPRPVPIPSHRESQTSQPIIMSALHFHTERLGCENPETPKILRKEWESVFDILRDYVQPDGTPDEAVDRTAEFYTNGYQKNSPINVTSIILGDQIPYDSLAHTKLAHFLLALGKSRKWLAESAHVRTLTSF
jgi:hypothetical protein